MLEYSDDLHRGRSDNRQAVLVQVSDFSLGRGLFLTRALREAGLRVSVVTNEPVYQHTRSKGNGDNDNVVFHSLRIPLAKKLYGTIPGRLIVYTLFSIMAFMKMLRIRAPILYSRGPQPFTEISCIAYKLFFPSTMIISDTTDLWPDSLAYVHMNHALRSFLIQIGTGVSKLVFARVDSVVTHNPELAKILHARFGKPIRIIYGVIDLGKFAAMEKIEAASAIDENDIKDLSSRFVVLYAGLLGPFQDPLKIIDIAQRLDSDTTFVVIGTGPLKNELQSRASELGLRNVTFLGTRPFEEMPFLYNLADVYLLTYAKLPFLKIGLPKKFIEYAACGKPILCVSPPCVASDLATSWNAGYCVDPDNIEDAARMIRRLRDDQEERKAMGRNARDLAENLFSIHAASEALKEVIQQRVPVG
ncbi:MAG: glycosyltransferase family 4 protein [Thaumarchaeota archaeon]|nr:glycosyltransferase family 4 protein [Nitrososphaerota archaeon]